MPTGVRLMVVRPHPDDESSATGGILARYGVLGVSTAVVTCTGGEEGEVLDPALDPEEAKPRLKEIREAELREACRILNVAEVRLLGYCDSGMEGWPANDNPAAFCNADLDEAAGRLVHVIRELQPQVVVTEPNRSGYGHPDHVKCFPVTERAFYAAGDASQYPDAGPPWSPARLYSIASVRSNWTKIAKMLIEAGITEEWLTRRRRYSRRWGITKKEATAAIDVSPYVEIQREALAAHRSQITPDSWWLKCPLEVRRVAFGTAYFVRIHPAPTPGEKDADVFAGLD
ncbi:MAG TPA: PIG-L family deacetylase [Chloroflexota bacterium]|jgi:mycothiol S-conjugate amidase